jgi:hypothetical protein
MIESLDTLIADAIRRDFRAMAHAIAQNDVAKLREAERMALDWPVGKTGTRGDSRLEAAFGEEAG